GKGASGADREVLRHEPARATFDGRTQRPRGLDAAAPAVVLIGASGGARAVRPGAGVPLRIRSAWRAYVHGRASRAGIAGGAEARGPVCLACPGAGAGPVREPTGEAVVVVQPVVVRRRRASPVGLPDAVCDRRVARGAEGGGVGERDRPRASNDA